jgi:hypothetical protein
MFITPILPETATIHDQALNKMIHGAFSHGMKPRQCDSRTG